jgi:nitroreductase
MVIIMDFSELVQKRCSVRRFSNKPIEKEKLDLVLRAAQLAPTARNQQPQRILVINNTGETLEKLNRCTPYHFNAPIVFLVSYDKNECTVNSFNSAKNSGEKDCSIILTHMMLQAADIGLGTTWVGYFDPYLTRELFEIPENYEPVSFMPIGYPADDYVPHPNHTNRLSLDKTVFYDKY